MLTYALSTKFFMDFPNHDRTQQKARLTALIIRVCDAMWKPSIENTEVSSSGAPGHLPSLQIWGRPRQP